MRALAGLLVFLLLAGCTSTTSSTEIFVNGERSGGIRIDAPMPPSGEPASPRVTKAASDPEAPPVTLEGARAWALPLLARELFREGARVPCGGAHVAVPAGAPDPRPRWGELTHLRTLTLVDERGFGWLTDEYAARDDEENATLRVWVQNVGGGRGWKADDGVAHCPPRSHGDREFHVLLHVQGPSEVDVLFSPSSRPAEPTASGPSPS